ncbi:MAG: phosphoglycerate kinase [Pseudohongiellaceae bacterium]
MTYKRMTDLDLSGQRVLIREDLNVPIDNGRVGNDARIRAALPTIQLARMKAKRVILMSHLGRPQEGVPIEQQKEFSLRPVGDHLAQLLGCQVALVSNYLENPEALDAVAADVILLENVRVNPGEGANSEELAARYAALCDVFVMDAFGTAHRAQASTHGVAVKAPEACAGPLLAGELDALDSALTNPRRPMLAIVGGAKVSSKLEVLRSLSDRVDELIVGGGIANTFLLASGVGIGKSLAEPDLIPVAQELMRKTTIPLPVDVVVATALNAEAEASVKAVDNVSADELILDIGPQTAAAYAEKIAGMQTILWNGPLGVFEFDQFAAGTEKVARAIAANQGFSLAGGGETVTAIEKYGVENDISYISTGGGAFLEYVEGTELPAVQVLKQRGQAQ